ncbi:MAG: hypothetical protein E7351_00460 [Clostridiales bacterium]|nr:hypothetical protein [Clostridiales bacterium]
MADEENQIPEGQETQASPQGDHQSPLLARLQENADMRKGNKTKSKLETIRERLSRSKSPTLKFFEKRTVNKAKAFAKPSRDRKDSAKVSALKKNINSILWQINVLTKANVPPTVSKGISMTPALFWICVIALGILIVAGLVLSIADALGESDDTPNAPAQSALGITGDDFYGARFVYRDATLARESIIEDIVDIVDQGIATAEGITTITKDSTTYDVTIDVSIAVPDEDYSYSGFDETSFGSDYPTLYPIVKDIAKSVYMVDNSIEPASENLVDIVDGIKYFGFNADIMTYVSSDIATLINNNVTFTSTNNTDLTLADVQAKVSSDISNIYTDAKYTTRTEKVFIQDNILDAEEDTLSVARKQYIAMIFMPKTDVKFTYFSFVVSGADFNTFSMDIRHGNDLINVEKDEESLSSSEEKYLYYAENVSVNASKYEFIDENNLTALSEGMSLYDILALSNHSMYLDNTSRIVTYRADGVTVSMNNTNVIRFVEFSTDWK